MTESSNSYTEENESFASHDLDLDEFSGVEAFIISLGLDIDQLRQIQRELWQLVNLRERIFLDILGNVARYRSELRLSDIELLANQVFFDSDGLRYPSNAISLYASDYKKYLWSYLDIPREMWAQYKSGEITAAQLHQHRATRNRASKEFGINHARQTHDIEWPPTDIHDEIARKANLYILKNGEGEIIYVGISRKIKDRLRQHSRGKFAHEIRSATLVEVDDDKLEDEERKMIFRLQPKHNNNSRKVNTWEPNKWAFS